jgi:hypothetical protein
MGLEVQLVAAIVALVDARISHAIGARTTGETYSTEPGRWPPGCRTRRSARDRIKAAGGERLGEGPASVWSITVDAYRAHYARRRAEKPAPERVAPVIDIDAAIRSAGYRMTRSR